MPVTAAVIAVREVGTIGACAAKAYAAEILPIQASFTAQGFGRALVLSGFHLYVFPPFRFLVAKKRGHKNDRSNECNYVHLRSPPKITTILGNGAAF